MNKAIGNSGGENVVKNLEVENVAESLGAVAIAGSKAKGQAKGTWGRKTAWNMKKIEGRAKEVQHKHMLSAESKRQLIDVITEGANKIVVVQNIADSFGELNLGVVSKELKRIEEISKADYRWDEGEEDIVKNKAFEKQCNKLLRIEEVILRQRSRALWLRDDDRNTKFFHGKENQRRKTNHIAKLKDDKGIWWRGEKHCERILLSYFSDIFSSFGPSNIEEVCQVVKGKINSQQKLWCQALYSSLDVKEALNQMHPLKALGSDRLPALFYQKYWGIVGSEI